MTNPTSNSPTPSHPIKIGWYGLGAMGYPMARNIATSQKSNQIPMMVYNRTIAKAEKLANQLGEYVVTVASSPAQLAAECDIIFTNLANDAAVQSVYNEFFEKLSQEPPAKSKIFVDTSTIYPSVAADLDKLLSGISRCHFVASPVFGPPATADAGTLVIVMSGDYRSKQEAAHLMVPGVGKKIIDLGGNVEKAPSLKLIGNGMILGANELLAESLTLGAKSGIGALAVYNLVKEIMPAPSLLVFGDKMVHDRFESESGSAIDLGIKDSMNIRRLAVERNCPMPAIDVAHQRLITTRSVYQREKLLGKVTWDSLDWSALIAGSRVAAGLEPFDSSADHVVLDD